MKQLPVKHRNLLARWHTHVDSAPRFLLRDGDRIYGANAERRIGSLGIEDVVTTPASAWQNPYVERVIGVIRRALLDRVIVMDRRHPKRLLDCYCGYYHKWRVHRSLDMDAPDHGLPK